MNQLSMEERFRYDCSGRWFKGSVHVHTTNSSGRLTPEEVAAFYAEAGYDFICITDKIVPFVGETDKYPLLVLSGIELDDRDKQDSYYHVVCIEGVNGVTGEMGLDEAIEKVRAQGGILVWAHPHTSNNTVVEGLRHGFHGVEVFNSIAQMAFGKGMGAFHWDASLGHQPDMLGFATDDAHFIEGLPAEKGGWIMVNAPELSREAILSSIHRGNFYSSNGPFFKSISIEQGNRIVAETSPVIHARLVGHMGSNKYRGAAGGEPLTDMHFRLPDDWSYARLEIEDAAGKMAWSNPLLRGTDN
ncbi:MAG TPA: hypothetical protein G4O10_08870 [Dehalococcoidia bacterium]|nr:hypothetical protein [Dehalococcoidia bacterium]